MKPRQTGAKGLAGRVVARALQLATLKRGWKEMRAGVDIRHLAGSADGPTAALLRYAPRARVPKHRHAGFEVIYVLEGEQSDERGTYAAGTLIVNPVGGAHSVWSEKGCLVLIVWERSIEFL